ncbi:MAG: hypothetical protein GTO19_18650 [Hydrogenophaga sp.]|nr:hypothetical protein [Hydrogenophaga sp.]NIN29188.1 hypothetical protein [Hydrogenophaga sp.]NIQ64160.1 hypothetical protein [Hydrogenophaga sp.]
MPTCQMHAHSLRAAARVFACVRQDQGQSTALRGHRLLAAHSSARR